MSYTRYSTRRFHAFQMLYHVSRAPEASRGLVAADVLLPVKCPPFLHVNHGEMSITRIDRTIRLYDDCFCTTQNHADNYLAAHCCATFSPAAAPFFYFVSYPSVGQRQDGSGLNMNIQAVFCIFGQSGVMQDAA